MSNETLRTLVEDVRSRRSTRRQMVKRATALGFSLPAIGASLRTLSASAQETTNVTFWTTFTDPDLSIIQGIVDTYNGQAQGHQVELVQIPPAEVTDVTKLMTAVRGGTGPDVYHLDRFIVAQRAADGLLQDITSQVEDMAENYLPFARAEASYDGKMYALPFDTDTRALYYNRAMLTEAGIDPAEFDAAAGALTWDRIKEIAPEFDVKDNSGNFTQMGFVPWVNQGWHYTYGFSWGGSFFDEAGCAVTPDDPPIVEAFQWVYDYCAALGPQEVSAFGTPTMQPGFPPQEHPFIQGRLAMQITGDWVINQMETYAPDADYGITFIPVPAAGDQPSTWAGGWSVVMPQGAQNPEEAMEFMRYIAGEEGQRTYVQESRHLPTWQALLEEDIFDERHVFFSQELLPIAKNRPPLPVGALYWDQLTTAWQAVYLNEEEPGPALQSVKERVNSELESFCPITIE